MGKLMEVKPLWLRWLLVLLSVIVMGATLYLLRHVIVWLLMVLLAIVVIASDGSGGAKLTEVVTARHDRAQERANPIPLSCAQEITWYLLESLLERGQITGKITMETFVEETNYHSKTRDLGATIIIQMLISPSYNVHDPQVASICAQQILGKMRRSELGAKNELIKRLMLDRIVVGSQYCSFVYRDARYYNARSKPMPSDTEDDSYG